MCVCVCVFGSTVVCRRGDTDGQTLTFLGSINAGC